MSRARRTLALVVACAVAGAGCGRSDGNDGQAASAAAQPTATGGINQPLDCTTSPSVQDVRSFRAPKGNEPFDVTYLAVSLSSYYYQALAYGAEQAGRDAGVRVRVLAANGYATPDQQLRQAETELQRGADALVFAPADFKGSVSVVERAKREDVPVVNISSEVDSRDVITVMQDDYMIGRLSADVIARLVPDGGEGVVMAGPANALWARKRVAGLQDQIKAKHPGLSIATAPNQQVDPAEGLRDFTNATQANPQIDWIFSTASAQLLPDSIPADYRDVPYVTSVYDPLVRDALDQDRVSATVSGLQVAMGYYGVARAVEALNGDQPPRTTCLPAPVLTKADIGSALADMELYPEGYRPDAG